jgi:GNAT superfamily N-acetyltransferase
MITKNSVENFKKVAEMNSTKSTAKKLKFTQVTPERWKDFEKLFGDNGACGGCWCMWWRLKRSQYEKQKGAGNKKAIKKIVNSGNIPGIIAYDGSNPVGWCAIEPRESYALLENSRVLKRIDDKIVWSVVCFFVDRKYRRKGVTEELLKAALKHAKKNKAKIVEGYPIDSKNTPSVFAWTGFASAFLKVGFKEVHRGSLTRPIMRYYL